jgi:hypothetical protein
MKKPLLLLISLLISEILISQTVEIEKITVSNYDYKVINDPVIDYKQYKTFSIVSADVLFKKEALTLEEKQIEYFLINAIEPTLSLKNIPMRDSIKPDLMIIYNFSNDYKERYIPPQTYSVPFWSPGKTTTINSNSSANVSTYGDVNVTGNINGNSNTTITQSGNWETTQVQRPAYTEGYFFPDFSLTIYNTSVNNKIWEGNANGTSLENDFRIPAQYLMWRLLGKMPKGSFVDSTFFTNNNGQIGISFYIFNTDGISFYPVIMGIGKNSPAESIGLKKGDVIVSINGQLTSNKSHIQISEMMKGNAGTKIELVINRKDKYIKKTLIKTLRNGL